MKENLITFLKKKQTAFSHEEIAALINGISQLEEPKPKEEKPKKTKKK